MTAPFIFYMFHSISGRFGKKNGHQNVTKKLGIPDPSLSIKNAVFWALPLPKIANIRYVLHFRILLFLSTSIKIIIVIIIVGPS